MKKILLFVVASLCSVAMFATTTINEINLSITYPKAGESTDDPLKIDDSYESIYHCWCSGWSIFETASQDEATGDYKPDTEYRVYLTFMHAGGYAFAPTVNVTINGVLQTETDPNWCTADCYAIYTYFTTTTTAIENVQNDNTQATKQLRNGQILIERNGHIYNVQGIEVK